MTNENDKLIKGHEYDGIQELDNPLPTWWLITFLGAIAYSFIYFLHIHLTPDNQIADEFLRDKQEVASQQASVPRAKIPEATDLAAFVAMPENIEKGKAHFATLCAACHGANGQGGIGPNLTDNFWIHGRGDAAGIATTVSDGVLDKGMPAWSAALKPDQVYQVAGFVLSLKGTNPNEAKGPQGEEIK